MSLDCYAYTVHPETGEMNEALGDGWPVGAENWRTFFYGAPIMERLGAQLLPLLRSGDIFAAGVELAQLETDVRLILSRWDDVASELFSDNENGLKERESAAQRLSFILKAIDLAKKHSGMVVIW